MTDGKGRAANGGNGAKRLSEITEPAVSEFARLSGYDPDRVSGARPDEDAGWSLLIDVVELERIPDTTSVLATYRVDTDRDGHVRSYERLRRFNRGATDL
jgi:hypothetical protein